MKAAAWCTFLAGSVWGLASLAPALPLTADDPAMQAFALLRVGAVVIAWYLAGVTALGLAARCLRLPALVRSVDALTVGPVRRLLHASLSAGITVTSLATPAGAGPPGPHAPVIRRVPGSDAAAPRQKPPPPPVSSEPDGPRQDRRSPDPAAPVLRRAAESELAPPADVLEPRPPEPEEPPPESGPAVRGDGPRHDHRTPDPAAPGEMSGGDVMDGDVSGGDVSGGDVSGGDVSGGDVSGGDVSGGEPPAPHVAPPSVPLPPPDPAPSPQPSVPPSTSTWRVARGESFWSVAESVVDGPEAEVARYWRTLIEANRDRLRDPSDPDLLFVGQELVLPSRGPP